MYLGLESEAGELVERSEGRDQIPRQIGQAGRGARSTWLQEKIKAGAKLEDFAVQRTVASRKASRRAKR